MSGHDDFSGFIREGGRLVREYVDVRMSLLRLQVVRIVSKAYGQLVVLLIASFMLFFVFLFTGMALSSWVSALTGSPVVGYLSAAGVFLLLLLLALLLKAHFFQDRMVRTLLDNPGQDPEGGDGSQ